MDSFRSILKLKSFIRPYLGLILISGLLAIPLSALRFSPAPLVKYLVDDLLVNRDESKLYLFPAILVALSLVNFVVRFFHYYLLRIVIARVNQGVKFSLYNHLMGLSADFFTDKSTGHLISRVGTDPQHVDGGVSCINVLIREPITFIFLFSYALTLNWRLTLITLVIFPLLAWVFAASGRNLKRYITRMSEENANVFAHLQESFSGFRIIKTFRLEKYLRNKFEEKIQNYTRIVLKSAAMEEASHPMVELLTFIAIAGVVFYGGLQVLGNQMSAGDLLAFFTAFALMMDPIRRLNEVNIKLNQAAGAADRINQILNWKSRLKLVDKPKTLTHFQSEIRFDRVSFAYPDEPQRSILSNVSFEIKKGQVVALVGASGSGKSSLASLLPRLFDPSEGQISIDGIDIKDLRFEDLRQLIAIVSQDVFLFNDTIEANIRCGKLDATSEEVIEAAQHANAYDFILQLPQQFQTQVGERGQKLSGGERQRISIARAFLRGAPILILDEATSNLDSASERAVQKALDSLIQNRTALVIAHRLSTIQNADHIIVLKEGKIVESGKHDGLLTQKGEYARFYSVLS